MIAINLVPAERRRLQRLHRRIRRWTMIGAAYGVFVAVGAVTAHVSEPAHVRATQADIDAARQEKRLAEEALRRLSEQLMHSEATLATSREVGVQPDWSVLLALLSEIAGEDVVLGRCAADTPRAADAASGAKPGAAGAPEPAAVMLELQGFGRDQAAVSQFVLRMEDMPLFQQVKIVESRREPFLKGHATSFRVRCLVDAGGEEGQP